MASDIDEAETLPQGIIAWQPRHRSAPRGHALSPEAGIVILAGMAILGVLAVSALVLGDRLTRRLDLSRPRA